jgi:oleate hydratase
MSAKAVNAATVKAHFVGGGIGSRAAAAFMIRDGKVPGENISVYEATSVLGDRLGNYSALNLVAELTGNRTLAIV